MVKIRLGTRVRCAVGTSTPLQVKGNPTSSSTPTKILRGRDESLPGENPSFHGSWPAAVSAGVFAVGPTFRLPSCRALLLQAKLVRVPLISPSCVLSPGARTLVRHHQKASLP